MSEIGKNTFQDINSGEAIALIWHVDDVLERAQERGISLSRDEAKEILSGIEEHHDCEVGVSWTTIDVFLDEYEQGR